MKEKALSEFESNIAETVEALFEEEEEKARKQLDEKIKITLMGNINTGKSTTINALMGENVSPVHSIPGETVKILEIGHPEDENIIFVDTPGLNDINKARSLKAMKEVKNADVVLYLLNAEGVILGENELNNLNKVSKRNENVIIVVNKVDGLQIEDITEIKRYIRQETEGQFEIVSISSKTGENIEELNDLILKYLSVNEKDLLFAKKIKNKSHAANKWITGASLSASAIGALPVPGADIIPLTALQVKLVINLSIIYDKPVTKDEAVEVILAAIVGGLGQQAFRQGVKLFPGIGPIIAASVAGIVTFGLGQSLKYAFERDIEVNLEDIEETAKMVTDMNHSTEKNKKEE